MFAAVLFPPFDPHVLVAMHSPAVPSAILQLPPELAVGSESLASGVVEGVVVQHCTSSGSLGHLSGVDVFPLALHDEVETHVPSSLPTLHVFGAVSDDAAVQHYNVCQYILRKQSR